MENKPYLQFWSNPTSRAILVGLSVTCLHFIFAYFIWVLGKYNGFVLPYIYFFPSLLLDFINTEILLRYYDTYFSFASADYAVPFTITSSLFYGVVAGLLASRKKILRVVAIAFFVIFFLVYIGYCLWFMAAFSQG
jgi:hypothetical protein